MTLGAEQLALPASVLDLITPPGNGYGRDREYFATRMAPVFDPFSAVEAAAAQTAVFLFAPERLNRLAWQHARDRAEPGIREMLDFTLLGTWQHMGIDTRIPAGAAVQTAANWVVLDALLHTLNDGALHPQVDAEVRIALQGWQRWLAQHGGNDSAGASRTEAADLIRRYLADPRSVTLRPLPPIPPGPPI